MHYRPTISTLPLDRACLRPIVPIRIRHHSIVAVFTLLTTLFAGKSWAQYEHYRFSRLDIAQGLSHNEINCFVKDEKGFLWIGTMSGLNRYDGYKFKIFKHDLRDTTSISDDYIENIFEGPGHTLWAFTRNGINIYDPRTEKFDRDPRHFLDPIHIPNGNLVGNIISIKKDSLGNYWFLSATSGMYRYDPSDKTTTRFFHSDDAPHSLHSNNITSFTLDGTGEWWIVYRDGIMEKMNGVTGRITERNDVLQKAVPGESLNYQAFADKDKGLWIYGQGSSKGVFYYNPAEGSLRHIDKGPANTDLNNNLVNGIIQDDKGLIWIATDHGGVNLLDKKDFWVHKLVNSGEDDKSISQNSINTMYMDKDGIVWLGTFKKGISYHHADLMKFPLFRRQLPDARNLNYDDVNRFAEDPKGNLWLGTNGGGLLYFNRQTGQFTQYLHDPSDPHSLSNDVIVSLCLDHEQKLWIGTYFGGLDCFDGRSFRHYRHNDSDTGSIADDRIWDILEDSRQQLWIGTFSQGLDLLDRKKNAFIHYKAFAPNSITSNYITGLMEDRKDNLWISTAYGIDVLDRASGLFRHYGHDVNNPVTSLSNDNTFSTLEDSRGLIWVATREGLNVLDPVTGLFRIFRKEDGLPDNTVLDLLEDSTHNLWLSTPDGLSNAFVSMDSSSRKLSCQFRNYDESDGLQGREFNENAALRTKKGELIFGGAYGFNIFDPQKIRHFDKDQTLTLTDLQVFNRSVNIGEKLNGHTILPQSISEVSGITLRYNENVFSLEFAALDFFDPEKVKYAYMLEGFKNEWLVSNDRTRKAVFTNLDPGDYTFRVRTADNKGTWNPRELSLNIKILPPFWKTPLAWIIYFLLLVGTLLLARRMILQRARARFAIEQERKEAQRLHELDMMKIRFFTNVSHEFRTPLSLILTPMDKIIQDTENPARRNQFQLIHRNARRLLNMVNQLLDFRKLEEQELMLSLAKGDIEKFIRELSFSFVDMAEKKNIGFSFHSSIKDLFTLFDQDKLERIVFNLLSNAFKFTPQGGSIRVELNLLQGSEYKQDLLQLMIKDTGIGIEKDKQEKIFDRFFQNEIPGSMVNQGSGIGLAITREFVRLHQGSIYVESEPGKGSSFTVLLPIERVDPDIVDSQGSATSDAAAASPNDPSFFFDPVVSPSATSAFPQGYGSSQVSQGSGSSEDPPSPQSPVSPHHGPAASKKPAILLVEDNEDFRFYLKDNLREYFTIIEAANGKEGWQRTLGSHPDLIVSDISMPEMNGIELCQKIRSDKRTSFVPVILLTALIGEEQQLKGLETGANDYMTKPFNFGILLSKIRNLLAQQETARKTWQKQVEAHPTKTKLESPDEKFIRQALVVIEKNISNTDFSVEEMSRDLFVSRVGLYKRVLALTGKTPIEFIRSIRLKRAAQLLEKSRFTVAEIAYESGFNNPKYFARYFKAEFGMLPSTYQAQKRLATGPL
ncbi:MAG TPA: two-component regulator propeller domain-containing protein [Puia sp.]|nr:two-component regulator propeller domain-containing protein [Puia sp.]